MSYTDLEIQAALAVMLEAVGAERNDDTLIRAADRMRKRIAAEAGARVDAQMRLMEARRDIEIELASGDQ